ncbi:MAG TPA: DNA primase [Bacteroidia bacterium]|nr:DNA primase [Bacteroidia bacterium]
MISKPTIARIIESARIEEVVADFLTLKKRGVNYIANCPFHNEKTPSFNVNPVRNIYKCFGCGKGGDSIGFVMEHEKMTYPEALRYIAKKYNIEIEELYDRNLEEEKKLENEKESLYVVNAYAQKYFTETLLNTDEGKSIGLSYFKERGLSDETIHKFQLGYAPDKRTAFTDTALKNGYNLEYLNKSGLTIKVEDEQGGATKYYDRFAGRVLFPIHNITGRIIGFGGRALKKDVKAKYVNSPENEIYHKSNVLYGMNIARKAISNEDNCFLVEGYMDVISMHQAGIENAVASSGTSLTAEQIKLIKRYTNNITIMYDGDAAGIKASFRGIDMILEEGLNVRVVLFPEGNDPDSYSRSHSETELKAFINENRTDFIRFKTQLLYKETDNDPIKKATLIQEIVNSIALIPSSITRSVFVQECAKLMKMDEQSLITELNKALRKRYVKRTDSLDLEEDINLDTIPLPQPIDTNLYSSEYFEGEIVRLLLNYGKLLLPVDAEEGEENKTVQHISVKQFIKEHLLIDEIHLENVYYKMIYDEMLSDEEIGLPHFLHHTDPALVRIAVDFTTSPYSISDWKLKHGIEIRREEDILKIAVEHTIYSLKFRKIMQMITGVQKELEEVSDSDEMLTLVAKKKSLDNIKNAFTKELRWVITR